MKDRAYKKRFLAMLAAAVLLAGCKSGMPIASDVKETDGYSWPQTMIVVATERNQYEQIYSNKIWSVKLPPEDITFQEYRLGQVREFLQELRTTTMLAAQEGITLDSGEKDQIKRLAAEYYSQLTPGDIAYMGIREEDVVSLYEEYHLANKVVNELTKDVDLEISDSEAKVIDIEQIYLTDQAEAAEVYALTQAEGADFAAIAKERSKSGQIERKLGRKEETGALEDAAFGLASGQVSEVIQTEEGYYILRCISDYDEEATQERKNQMYLERKKAAFGQIYNQFKAEHPVVFDDAAWKQIVFSPDDDTSTTNFFELYQKYFKEQSS